MFASLARAVARAAEAAFVAVATRVARAVAAACGCFVDVLGRPAPHYA